MYTSTINVMKHHCHTWSFNYESEEHCFVCQSSIMVLPLSATLTKDITGFDSLPIIQLLTMPIVRRYQVHLKI